MDTPVKDALNSVNGVLKHVMIDLISDGKAELSFEEYCEMVTIRARVVLSKEDVQVLGGENKKGC